MAAVVIVAVGLNTNAGQQVFDDVTSWVTDRFTKDIAPQDPLVQIEAYRVAFDKDQLILKAGSKTNFIFVNEDSAPHMLVSRPLGIELLAEAKSTKRMAVTPSATGAFPFRCKLHPKVMRGTITVED